MGAQPKRKISTRRKGKRRINHKISLKNLVKTDSNELVPHNQKNKLKTS